MDALAPLVHRVGMVYVNKVTAAEVARQRFTRTNERPVEYSFVFSWLNRLQPKTILDVGTGQSALPALLRTCGFVVSAIDNVRDYWPTGLVNRHWRVNDEDITTPNANGAYDATLCISVLEHIADPIAALQGLHQRTRPGGHVLLTTPFGAEGHSNVYTLPGSYGAAEPYPCRQSCPDDQRQWLQVGFTCEHVEYWRAFESPYWSVGPLLRPLDSSQTPAHLGCFVMRRR